MDSASPLRANAHFLILLLARSISWVGSAVTLVALPLALYQSTGSASLTALLTAAESAPYLVFGLLAGAFADRWPRRATMVVTNVVAGVAIACIPVAGLFGFMPPWFLLAVAAGSATALVFFDAAGFGLLPSLVPRDQLPQALSTSSGVNTAIMLLGPAVGGVLASAFGATRVLALDAASFVVCAILLARLPENRTAPASDRRIGADIVEGLRFVWTHVTVRTLTLLGTANSLIGGMVLGLVVATAVQRFGLPDQDPRIGLCYTMLGVGTLLASLTLPWLTRRLGFGRVALGALFLGAAASTALALVVRLTPGLVVLLVWQAANSLLVLNGITYRQQVTPDHLQGRVNTTARMIAWGGQPLGAAVGAAITATAGIGSALWVAAGLGAVTFLGGVGSRSLRAGTAARLVPP